MPYALLGPNPALFPHVEDAEDDGIVAIGGDLSVERLLNAYSRGIFPWYSEGLPILWHSPNPRFVLELDALHVPKSLAKQLKRGIYQVKYDTAFEQVIDACARVRRPGQRGTWITRDMKKAYVELHQQGFAHSIESYAGGQLVGGLYGVSLGNIFFGESMFAQAPDASKVAFVTLALRLKAMGVTLVDCQQETEHLRRFGAEAWPRPRFIAALGELVTAPTRRGSWA
ncbi:MAG: leucyl/phenylalanyl-tRNA--protein transferase [Myxococcaceae bacterium]|nr:leucyl/phenylalanyl-tRNA--protein transferase [Myxococcaceae bacterium]